MILMIVMIILMIIMTYTIAPWLCWWSTCWWHIVLKIKYDTGKDDDNSNKVDDFQILMILLIFTNFGKYGKVADTSGKFKCEVSAGPPRFLFIINCH